MLLVWDHTTGTVVGMEEVGVGPLEAISMGVMAGGGCSHWLTPVPGGIDRIEWGLEIMDSMIEVDMGKHESMFVAIMLIIEDNEENREH